MQQHLVSLKEAHHLSHTVLYYIIMLLFLCFLTEVAHSLSLSLSLSPSPPPGYQFHFVLFSIPSFHLPPPSPPFPQPHPVTKRRKEEKGFLPTSLMLSFFFNKGKERDIQPFQPDILHTQPIVV